MNKISTIKYLGSLRTQATHLASGNQIITDAPTDNHGKGEAFSPSDLVASALASCMMTIIGIKCEQMGLAFDIRADVEKIMSQSPRCIQEVVIDIHVDANLAAEQQKLFENAAHTCPVGKSLHEDIKQTVRFHYKN